MTDKRIRIVLTVDGTQYEAGFNQATSSTRKLGQQGVTTAGQISQLRGSLDSVGFAAAGIRGKLDLLSQGLGALGIATGAVGLVQLLSQVSQTGIEFERLSQKLNITTGGGVKTGEAMAFIRREADRLGTSVIDTGNNFASFAASTKGTQLEGEKTRLIFSSVSEASAKLGLSQADTNGLFLAFQQIASKGVVSSEELRQQIAERLPGGLQIAARALGVTTGELNKMLEQGQVISDDFLPKFAEEIRKTFGTDANTRIETTQSNFSRLGNEIRELANVISAVLNPALDAAAGGLASALKVARTGGVRPQAGGIEGGLGRGIVATSDGLTLEEAFGATRARSLLPQPNDTSLVDGLLSRYQAAPPEAFSLQVSPGLRSSPAELNLRRQIALEAAQTEREKVEIERTMGRLQSATEREITLARALADLQDQKKSAAAGVRAQRQDLKDELEARRAGLDFTQQAIRQEAETNDQLRKQLELRNQVTQSSERTLSLQGYSPEDQKRVGAQLDAGDAYSQQQDTIDSLYDAKLLSQEEYQRASEAALIAFNQRVAEINQQRADSGLEIQKQADDLLLQAQLGAAQAAIGLLGQFAGQSKSVRLALLAFDKAVALAQIFISTQIGAARALELGPIVGLPLAAKIQLLGNVQLGLVAATGVVQAAQIEGGREFGGPVYPGEKRRVAERGRPELLDIGGDTFLLTGSEGGNVRPATRAGSSSGAAAAVTVKPVVNITNMVSGTEVKTSVGPGGEIELLFAQVDQRMAAGIASGRSATAKQLQQTHGLSRYSGGFG